MKNISKSLILSATAASFCFSALAQAQSEQLQVVTSFSILKDMVEQVAGDEAQVSSLVGPNGDTHVFSPSPADARKLSQADMLVINGLEFEGWMERLIEASGFDGRLVVATNGVETLAFDEHGEGEHHDDHDDEHHDDHDDEHHDDHDDEHHDDHDDEHHDDHDDEHHDDHEDEHHDDHDDEHHDDHDDHGDEHAGHDHHDHGEFDPHAWQSLSRAAVYVDNITAALAEERPSAAAGFTQRSEAYAAELAALDARLKADFATIDEHCRTVVTSHDAFQYFGADYGLKFVAPQGLSTASEASAKDVAALIEQVRDGGVAGIFVENISDSRLIEQIASETSLVVGGTLFSGALSEASGPAPTYLSMIAHNADKILTALQAAEAAGVCEDH